jgi:competence protein ComFC
MFKLIKNTLQTILWIIFPKRPDADRVDQIDLTEFVKKTRPQHFFGVTALLLFSDEEVRACIHELKYHQNQQALNLLGSVLNQQLKKIKSEVIVIPIPLSKARHRSRGYNQAYLLAKAGSQNIPYISIKSECLIRVKDTKSQIGLNKLERQKNIKGAFVTTSDCPEAINGKHVILLDDVVTTGATLGEAKAALLPHHPASITCLALAH